jgi:hypothetical protein
MLTEQLQKIPISVFKNAMSTEPCCTTLGVFLNSKKHLPRVQQVREAATKEVRDQLKKKLPAATISGTFNVRKMDGIVKYNGLCCMDFDAADNPHLTGSEMKAILMQYPEVAYAGLSVSGKGVFAIVVTNNIRVDCHAYIVDFLGQLFAVGDGIIYDKSGKDVCRLRFVSHDEQAYWNPNPVIFDAQKYLPRLEERETRPPKPVYVGNKKRKNDGNKTREDVERLIEQVEAAACNVTQAYDDWIKIGMAIAAEFGADGEDYFMRISSLHPKFDAEECRKKYKNFLSTASAVKIGTFFHILNNQGIRIS